MTHTPGPWKAVTAYDQDDGTLYFQVFETRTGDRAGICTSQEMHLSREEMAANAHLIAAAPETKEQRDELLDACESLVRRMEATFDFFPETCDGVSSIIVEDAKTAIAKAKGES